MTDYDAFLLVSFGGPEGPADVMPFLEHVTRGRGVPRDRLAEVAHHYDVFGGVSPINEQCRDLLAAIGKDFAAAGLDLPLYWGNRNWHPFLADTVAQMASDGARHAIAFVTSAYGSFSSCRQYLDDIEAARAQVRGAPRIDKIRHFFNHPGFIGPVTQAARAAITALPPVVQHDAWLVFTAHSVPAVMAAASGPAGGLYPAQLAEASRLVAAQLAAEEGHERPWRLCYQSRSGPPAVPWLGPDICDQLADLAAAGGAPAVVVVPVGFVSDHVEVLYDLDIEAAAAAERLGLPMARAATPGTDPRFVSMITELVVERRGQPAQVQALGSLPPGPDFCPNDCCRMPAARRAAAPGAGR